MRGDTITVTGLKNYYFYTYKMIIREHYEVYATTFKKFLEKTQTSKALCFLLLQYKFSLPFIRLWFFFFFHLFLLVGG